MWWIASLRNLTLAGASRLRSAVLNSPRVGGGLTTCSPQGNNRMSTLEDNKRIALRWFDLVTQGRVEELCAMTAPTWTMHGGPPSLPAGPDGIRALFASFGRVEQTWSIQDMIAEGDKVAVRGIAASRRVSLAYPAMAAAKSSPRPSSSGSWTDRFTRSGAMPTISDGCSSSGRGLSQQGLPRNLFGYLRRSC